MRRKIVAALTTMLIIIISLTQVNYSATTRRAALYLLNDGKNDAIKNASISVVQTIEQLENEEFIFKVEVENFQEEATEVALILDNSFSMWSESKIATYQEKMISTVNAIYEKIPDTYMSLSGYSGIIQEMTGDKEKIIAKINSITEYQGINAKTGLNYAKSTFTEKAKNKHIIVFTDGEETEASELAIEEIQANEELYLTAVMMGENITKQTEYEQQTRTKIYMIENIAQYNFDKLYSNIANWVYSSVDKEINNVVVNGKYTDIFKNAFSIQINKQPNLGQLVINSEGYTLTVPQITTQKVTFELKVSLKAEVDRTFLEKTINILKSTTINYDYKREEPQTIEDTEKTPSVQLLEQYSLELTVINKEFQQIKVSDVECTVIQKDSEGNIVKTYEKLVTDSDGKIVIDDFTHSNDSTLQIKFDSIPKPYESKDDETISISKDAITGEITVIDTTLLETEAEFVKIDNSENIISAQVAIPPKIIVFNITKTNDETGEPISDIQFSLKQPETKDIPKDSIIYGTTDESGSTKISAEVAGVKQKTTDSKGKTETFYYTYTLKEENFPIGYVEEKATTSLKVHFSEEGEIAGAYMVIDDEEIGLEYEKDVINVDITNRMKYYTLNIKAIDEEYNQIPVAGAEFQVTGTNENGVEVVNKQGITDESGKLQLEISAKGKVTYTIKQIPEHAAYETIQDITYVLTREFETNNITLNSGPDNFAVDNDKKVLTATIPLTPKKFTVKINKYDLDELIPVKGVILELEQPDGRDSIEATTGNDGIAEFTANVICDAEGGINKYKLKETQKASGYKEINEKMTVEITFDSTGNVINVEEESDILDTISKESKKVELKLSNEQQKYTIKVQAKHKKYNEILIKDVNLYITGKTADTENVFYQSDMLTTDNMGMVSTEDIKKSGDLIFTIDVENTPVGYNDFGSREIKVNKNLDTENLELLENNNEDVKVSINNTDKIIEVTLYFEPQTFNVEIKKEDLSTANIYIADANFEITQPDITYLNEENEEEIQKRENIEGTTIQDEILMLQIENPVLGDMEERTFSYVLSEESVPEGYEETKLELSFDITIDESGKEIKSIGNVIESSEPVQRGEITESKDDITTEELKFLKESKLSDGNIIFTIGNKQKGAVLNVLAINKKYENVPVVGSTIKVIAKDSNGNEFYNKELITDENGYISISGISQTGDFSIELIATKVPTGYIPGSTKTIELYRDVLTTEITIKNEDPDIDNKGDNKVINAKLPIDIQTFNFEISKLEKLYGNTLIQGAKITITQPKFEKYNTSREKAEGQTVKGEKLVLIAEVAGEGTYSYTISEKIPNGYIENEINTTLMITFNKAGEITKVEKATDEKTVANEEKVTLGQHTTTKVPVTIMNEQMPYTIKIEVLDSKYDNVGIEGVTLNLIGTNLSGQVYNEQKTTDENGEIEHTGLITRGDVDYKIQQIKVPIGYKIGQDKIIKMNKDWDTTKITLREKDPDVKIDDNEKIITVKLYIEPQTFEIRLDKVDKFDNSIYVPDATFELTQPDFKTGEKREKYREETKDTTIIFTAEVAGAGGPYTYTLKETNVPDGYIALAQITNLNITFDENGNVEKVEKQEENEFAILKEMKIENVIEVQISNEKKVHSMKIVALNEEDHGIKVEGVNVKLIGKDASGNTLIEKTGKTDSEGIVIFEELIGCGDITYEIIQEETRPIGFYLGENKTVLININENTNDITNNTEDDVTKVNNNKRQISTEIYLKPQKFTITLNKIDYYDRNLMGDVYIKFIDNKWEKEVEGRTVENEKYVITGYVPGEGEYIYQLDEGYYRESSPGGKGIPKGYKNYLNTHELKIEFDSDGNIVNKELVKSTWYKVFWSESAKQNSVKEYDDLKYHTIEILNKDENTNDIEIQLTNVKKQLKFKLNAINSKYTNEEISNAEFRITAYDENGNEVYNNLHTTDEDGEIIIGDQDVFKITEEMTFVIDSINVPSMVRKMPSATVAVKIQEDKDEEIIIDETQTSSHVTATAEVIEDKYNTNDFKYIVNVEVQLEQKTFDLELTKVNSFKEEILLKGAKFTLTQPDGEHSQTETTGEDGKIIFSADLYGETTEYKYILKEDKAPSGHFLMEELIELYVSVEDENVISARLGKETIYVNEPQVENNKKVSITTKNDAEPGHIFNVKLIEKYNSEKVEGSKYNIYIDCETNEKLNVTDITDEDGTIEVNKIPGNGEITIKVNHLENAPGYKLMEGEKIVVIKKDASSGKIEVVKEKTSEDITVRINENTVIIEIENTEASKVNKIQFETVDRYDENIKVSNVELNLLTQYLENVINLKTNSNGIANMEEVQIPGEGSYEYSTTVTSVPSEYFDYLENIKFGIEFDGEIITNIQKITESENYEVEYEVIAEPDTTTYKAKIKIKIEPKDSFQLKIIAQEKDNPDIRIEGAEFDITSIINDTNETTESVTTDEKGEATTKQDSGNKVIIYIKQTKTDIKHIIEKETKKIVLNKKDDGSLEIDTNETTEGLDVKIEKNKIVQVIIENELKPAEVNLQIVKLDSSNEAIRLGGVKLKLIDETNSKEYELTTDESGQILLDGLKIIEPGEYNFLLKEISTLEGYELPLIEDGEYISFKIIYERIDEELKATDVIQENGKDIVTGISYTELTTDTAFVLQLKLLIENNIDPDYKYTVNVYKRDKDTKELLQGAGFEFKSSFGEDNTISTTIITTEEGKASFDIPLVSSSDNIFEIKETKAPDGYKLDEILKTIILNKDETTGEVTILNSENIEVEDINVTNEYIDIYIYNEPIKDSYQIELTKVDIFDVEKILAGAKYNVKIESEDGYIKEYEITTGDESTLIEELEGYGNIKITLTEIEAPSGYKINEPIIINVNRDQETKEITFVDKSNDLVDVSIKDTTISIIAKDIPKGAIIEINKVDKDDESIVLAGVEFDIDGEEFITNEEGKIEGYSKIEEGTLEKIFTITEKKTLEGYKLSPEIKLKVAYNDNGDVTFAEIIEGQEYARVNSYEGNIVDITITNEKIDEDKYIIELTKVDIFDVEKILAGAKYEVKIESEDGYTNELEIITEEESTLIEELEGYGNIKITLTEIEAPSGYKINDPIIINVNRDKETNEITFIDKSNDLVDVSIEGTIISIITKDIPKGSIIEINKVDKEDESIVLPGVEFNIDGEEFITNEEGQIKGYSKIEEGTLEKVFTITEIKTLDEYKVCPEIKLKVTYNDNGDVIFAEIIEGQEYARVNSYEGNIVDITIINEKEKPVETGIDIEKVDSEDSEIKLKDVIFEVKILEENIQLTTDENGLASTNLENIRTNKTYEIVINELSTVNGYKLNQTPIKIILETDDLGNIEANLAEENEFIELKVEDNRIKLIIKNEKIAEDEYIIEIEKQSDLSENIKLSNAKYEVKIDNGEETREEEIITNTLGIVQIQDLIFDKSTKITLKEIEAPEGYELDEEEKEFVVELDEDKKLVISNVNGENINITTDDENRIIKVVLIDKAKNVNIEVEKVDKENENIKLSNVEFRIEDKQGKTDENGIFKADVGNKLVNDKKIYTIEELNISSEYIKLETPIEIEVTYDENAKISNVEILTNEEYVEYIGIEEDTIKLKIKNAKVEKYQVELTKVDIFDVEKILAGAKYNVKIESEDGYTKELEIITGEESTLIEELKGYGNIKITLTEIEAPSGYKINAPIIINVNRDKETNEITFVDKSNDLVDVSIEDTRISIITKDIPKGSIIEINKVDKEDESIVLPGVEFNIDGEEFITNEEGQIKGYSKIEDGILEKIFTIAEIRTLDEYKLCPEIKLKVTYNDNGDVTFAEIIEGQEYARINSYEGNIVNITIINEKIEKDGCIIEIEKVDKEDERIKLSNVEFRIEDKQGKTDKNGIFAAYVGEKLINDKKIYTIEELKISSEYIKLETPTRIEVTYDENANISNVEILTNEEYVEFIGIEEDTIKLRIKNAKAKEDIEKIFKPHLEKYVSKVDNESILTTEPNVSMVDEKIQYSVQDTNPIHVQNGNIVIYTLRIYNEGNMSGYAEIIQDNIPEGLEFLENHEINKKYDWKKVDEKTVETNILSRSIAADNVIEGFDGQNLHYRDIQIAFKVIDLGVYEEIINIATIDKAIDIYGNYIEEKIQDDAIIKVDYFNLSIQKYVSKMIVRKDGVITKTITANGNDIPKVEIRKAELPNTTVEVEYTILIKNEGNIEGRIEELKDYIPEGMIFDPNNNPNWSIENNIAKYKNQDVIQVQETKAINIKLNWNSNSGIGLKENIVEVSGENESNVLNNKDEAQCFIITSTGIKKQMIILPISMLGIFALGVYGIKKYVL